MLYSTELELIFHRCHGLAFQNFFNELMALGVSGFCPIRQRFDGGNDGFVEETGTFYQVFSPESITSKTVNAAASKIIDDFEKLLKSWHYHIEIKEYVFVFNDKFMNSDRSLAHRIKQLKDDFGVNTRILTAFNLLEIFHSKLTDTQKEIIISRHSIGRVGEPALKIVAKLIKNHLPIERWKQMDECFSFRAAYKGDLDTLSNLRSTLFSMDFPSTERDLINPLIDSIGNLVNLFYAPNTTENNNGERTWDKSWKIIHNNPKANYYLEQEERWGEEIIKCSMDLCEKLNSISKLIRQEQIPDFLEYRNYSIIRRKAGTLDEYVEIIG